MQPSQMIHSIQLLRGLAALMVVFHHARHAIPGTYNPLAGFEAFQAGVDIFFIISGFIMYSAARDEAVREFVIKRAIRLVPLYWAVNAAKLLLVIVLKGAPNVSFVHFLLSIFFIPYFSPTHSGYIWPYLIPGWSLNFEVAFYVVFAVSLYFSRPFSLAISTMIVLVVVGWSIDSDSAIVLTYTSPILLEFVAGILLAKYAHYLRHESFFGLAFVGFALIVASNSFFILDAKNFTGLSRVLIWGVPALLIVAGFLSIENKIQNYRGSALELLGNASYGIYLSQEFAINGAAFLVRRMHFPENFQFAFILLLSILLSICLGVVAYYVVEKPLIRTLRDKLLTGRKAQ